MKRFIFFLLLFTSFCFNINAQLRIQSQYRRTTMEDRLKPLMIYKSYFDECDQELITLRENAQQIEPYIDKDKDPICWGIYIAYYNSVGYVQDALYRNGASQNIRSNITQLRRRFSEINSIIEAYNRRADLANVQYQRLHSTNQRCDRYYLEISLDEFLDGKTPVVNYYE